jgi:hypothetical protein
MFLLGACPSFVLLGSSGREVERWPSLVRLTWLASLPASAGKGDGL